MRTKRLLPYLMISPVILLLLFLFISGITYAFLQSIGIFPIIGLTEPTISYYMTLFSSNEFRESFIFTMYLTFVSTVLSIILALFFCFMMLLKFMRTSRLWSIFQRIYQIPMFIPHVVGAYLVVLLFIQSGYISRFLYHTGALERLQDFPLLISDPLGIGIILGYVWKETPFIILMLFPVLIKIREQWLTAAESLGASAVQSFIYVVMPLLSPPVLFSGYIVFSFVFTAYELPYILGSTFPKALSVLSLDWYQQGDLYARPLIMALNFVILFVLLGIGILIKALLKKWYRSSLISM
jgi:putative spermidine/putrescine transport system permease protein